MRRFVSLSAIAVLAATGCAGDVPTGVNTEHGLEINLQIPDTVESGWWFSAFLSFTNHTDANMYIDTRRCLLTVLQGGRLVPVEGATADYCDATGVRIAPEATVALELPFRAVLRGVEEQPVEPGKYVLRSEGDYEYWADAAWRVVRTRIEQRFVVGSAR